MMIWTMECLNQKFVLIRSSILQSKHNHHLLGPTEVPREESPQSLVGGSRPSEQFRPWKSKDLQTISWIISTLTEIPEAPRVPSWTPRTSITGLGLDRIHMTNSSLPQNRNVLCVRLGAADAPRKRMGKRTAVVIVDLTNRLGSSQSRYDRWRHQSSVKQTVVAKSVGHIHLLVNKLENLARSDGGQVRDLSTTSDKIGTSWAKRLPTGTTTSMFRPRTRRSNPSIARDPTPGED
jgi:hypothetical protein